MNKPLTASQRYWRDVLLVCLPATTQTMYAQLVTGHDDNQSALDLLTGASDGLVPTPSPAKPAPHSPKN